MQINNQIIGMTPIGLLGMGKQANSWAYIYKLMSFFYHHFIFPLLIPLLLDEQVFPKYPFFFPLLMPLLFDE